MGNTRPISHVAAETGISRACASKWMARYREHGELGLLDRPSVPHHQPTSDAAWWILRSARPDKAGVGIGGHQLHPEQARATSPRKKVSQPAPSSAEVTSCPGFRGSRRR